MRNRFKPASVEVAWCPFVAFRIAIKNGELKGLNSGGWSASRLAARPSSPCGASSGTRRNFGPKRHR